MNDKAEKHEFKAEVSALLRLVTNSLYTNREIFLRELLSNASDALDKARFQGLVDSSLRDRDAKPAIQVHADEQSGVLVIEDNGIGMTRDEVVAQPRDHRPLGHPALPRGAASGSGRGPDHRGQRGQADRPVRRRLLQRVHGRRPHRRGHPQLAVPEPEAVVWRSSGDGTFTIVPSQRAKRGTTIELHLKGEAKEFLERWRLETVIRRYSNYVTHPIKLALVDEQGERKDEPKQVNAAAAIWMRPAERAERRRSTASSTST